MHGFPISRKTIETTLRKQRLMGLIGIRVYRLTLKAVCGYVVI